MASMPVPGGSPTKRGGEEQQQDPTEAPPAKRLKSEDSSEDGDGVGREEGMEGGEGGGQLTSSPKDGSRPPKPHLSKLDLGAASMAGEELGAEGQTPNPLFGTPTTPHPNREVAERLKAEAEIQEREKMQLLVSSFTEDQLDRYAMYRRAALPKATIKKVMQQITGTAVGHNVVIAMAGIAKVFAGEVVEEALSILEAAGEEGQPLRPKHLREAMRRMRARGAWVPKSKKTCPFT